MRVLITTIVTFLIFTSTLLAQDQEFLNIVVLDEPAWIYRARADRLFRQGRYGDALAQYKKALIRRNQGTQPQPLDGIDTELGLSRQNNDYSLYVRRLAQFLNIHGESSERITNALEAKQYSEARDLIQKLKQDAVEIGAQGVVDDAHALDRSVYLRKTSEWDYLKRRLFESVDRDNYGSLTVVLLSLNNRIRENRDGRVLDLREGAEGGAVYPEVHLSIAQVYMREGVFELALQELEKAEQGREYFQIPDQVYTLWYTRADIYRMQGRMSDYERQLLHIIDPEHNDSGDGDENFKVYGDMSLHKVSDAAVKILLQNAEMREKYGKAYFEYGRLTYESGRRLPAEPYLKMALLYAYGYEQNNAYAFVKDTLKEYYITSELVENAKHLDHIDEMIRENLKTEDETSCISF